MSLVKKFQEKYGKINYERTFSKDFREAVKSVDVIMKIVSKEDKEKPKKIKCN